jgi:streptogramin lyase
MKLRVGPLSLLLLFGVSSAIGQTFTEFQIPTASSRPKGITAGPDGSLWFTEYEVNASKIGRITPEGVITEFPLPDPFAHPLAITTGPDGNLWFTENRGPNAIARMTPEGVLAEFRVTGFQDPNPSGITTGPDGDLWFTEEWANKIGHITTSGEMTQFTIPPCQGCGTFALKSGPGGIALGPDGALWFAEMYANKIGRITTSGEITQFSIPEPAGYPDCSRSGPCGPVSITPGPDGAMWFTDSAANKIGRITMSGEITEFSVPTPDSQPNGIVAGLDGNLYFTEYRGNKIGRITTSGAFTEFPIPTPGASPWEIALGPDGALWFTEEFGNKIGRFSPGSLTCEPDATTLCLNDGRFKVQLDWHVPSQNRRGQGTAVPLTGDTGYFWFFEAANVELVVKALDARSVNEHFWIFYGALSNVEYTMTVVDTQTGRTRSYFNPSGTLASVADTSAFSAIVSPSEDARMTPIPASKATESLSAAELYEMYAALAPASPVASIAAAACVPGSTTLCLRQGRFQVRVDWSVPSQGRSGSGAAVPVTGDTGYLWFFSEANVELIVKVLDGRSINGHFWVFYGALSNVEYTINVLDTETGAVRTYSNPSGNLASHADTSAF